MLIQSHGNHEGQRSWGTSLEGRDECRSIILHPLAHRQEGPQVVCSLKLTTSFLLSHWDLGTSLGTPSHNKNAELTVHFIKVHFDLRLPNHLMEKTATD